jgi:hypothetical protein
MSAAPLFHGGPAVVTGDSADHSDGMTVAMPLHRMQHLETCELRTSLDAETIRLLKMQVAELQDALALEHTRSEKHAEAFMRVSRSSDDRARELEAQRAAAIIAKDTFIAKLEDAKNQTINGLESTIRRLETALGKLEAENAALKAQAESRLTEILTAVTTGLALEIHPVRSDGRQFAERHGGPAPPLLLPPPPPLPPLRPLAFPRSWLAASLQQGMGTTCEISGLYNDIVSCLKTMGAGTCTLRTAAPLVFSSRRSVCRFIIISGPMQCAYVGLLPSTATPRPSMNMQALGGRMVVIPGSLLPGGAIELGVDRDTCKCKVGVYTPGDVAAGYPQPPLQLPQHEVDFTGTAFAADGILYPAVSLWVEGVSVRVEGNCA